MAAGNDPLNPEEFAELLRRVEELLDQAARLRADIETARQRELRPSAFDGERDRRRGERRSGIDRRRSPS